MSVTYSGTALPTCTGTTSLITNEPIFSVGCSNARTDNLVAFKFEFENVGNRILAGFQPYAVFVTSAGPSGTTTQTQIGLSSQGISNLLPDDEVTLETNVIDISPGTTVTSLIVVPNPSSIEPYPTWPVSLAGSDSWCSQEQNPSPCQLVYMGVETESVDSELQQEYSLPTTAGAYIIDVETGSPAAAAGLQPGDLVTAIDGVALPDAQSLSPDIQGDHPGQIVQVSIWRGQQQLIIPVTLGLSPAT